MPTIDDIILAMRSNPAGISFRMLERVCEHFFGPARVAKGSHRIYGTPWTGDPRINIQDARGKAKAYRVRQVLKAIEKLTAGERNEE